MKNNKSFLYAILSMLAISSLVACGGNKSKFVPAEDDDEDVPLEVGDTVREWVSSRDFETLPFDISSGTGVREIAKDFGMNDKESLHYEINSTAGYLTTDIENPFFLEGDAKNGDIISLYVYLPSDSNISLLTLELHSYGYRAGWGGETSTDEVEGTRIIVGESKTEKWLRLEGSYDILRDFGSIRLKYEAVDAEKPVELYVDDINITFGEETVKTRYVYNDESLAENFEDYFRIGCCMSSDMLRNSELRKIAKQQFNSLTAENEGKPEHVIDISACQALADKSKVVITMEPFEKIYSWCEANHVKVRHHTFVWYSQTPDELFTEDYTRSGKQASRELMLKRMDSFMQQMIEGINERWPELVYAIDVVNEAADNGGAGYNKGNKWFDTVGEDFVYQAFVCASKYKEDYQDLYYNDYAFDYAANKERLPFAFENYLKRAIAEKLVDGVGLQAHIDCDNYQNTIDNAKLIKEQGLKCQITELDMKTSDNEDGYNKQKDSYKDLVAQILENNASGKTDINAFVVWGITDDLSWIQGNQAPLLFSSSFEKKPAYYGMQEALLEFLQGHEEAED